jgi:mono/diheme cytochrome c family protein
MEANLTQAGIEEILPPRTDALTYCMPKLGFSILLTSVVLSFALSQQFVRKTEEAQAATSADFAPKIATPILHHLRSSPLDLEIGGELAGVPPGAVRYVTRADLMALPQVTYSVADDANFTRPTDVSGVLLEELTLRLGAAPTSNMVIAMCDDLYRAYYPQAYVASHHPLLVLEINGQPPERWPKDSEGHGMAMGPFMISHAKFTPGNKMFSHTDEPQIPWGVVRLEFRNERAVFNAIAPRGAHAADVNVQSGYYIAQRNCLRCHNMGGEGGQKAGRPWQALSAWATSSPGYFAAYVRNPRAWNAKAQMPGNPGYDDATIHALIEYFQTLSAEDKR